MVVTHGGGHLVSRATIMAKGNKITDTTGQSEPRNETPHCILHTIGVEHDPFTSLGYSKAEPSEFFIYLRNIRDRQIA